MNRNGIKLSCVTLVLMVTLSSLAFLAGVRGQARPSVFVSLKDNVFYTDTTNVGDKFTVNISAADWTPTGLYGFEFKLFYDKTLLKAVNESGYPSNIKTGFFIDTLTPGNGTINLDEGYILYGAGLLGDDRRVGGGLLAQASFEIITGPPAGQTVSCALALPLSELIMVNPDTGDAYDPATYDVIGGTYAYVSPPIPKPYLKVSSKIWSNSEADSKNRLFNITVDVLQLEAEWHVVGLEFRLQFNSTLITTNKDWIFEGDFAKYFAAEEPFTFFVKFVEEDVLVGQLQLPPWPGPHGWMNTTSVGSGNIATIQFNATYSPPPAAECPLTLTGVLFVDVDSNPLVYEPGEKTAEDGIYKITVAAPPYLSIFPTEETVAKLGDTFTLDVKLNELDKGWRLVGAEFKVFYNTTLLETNEDNITEGDFLKSFAQNAGTTTAFFKYVEEAHGLVGIIILPLDNGTYPADVFPEGTGVLASFTFKAIYQHPTLDITTDVTVGEPLLADVDAKEIPANIINGTCAVTIKKAFVPVPAERMIDVFTQYDAPFGGQGLGVASDAFAPQGQVQLYSNVTYRGEPVMGKPVAYRIVGPNNYEFLAVQFSDENGLALLEFSIPASQSYFGIWNVSGSVDIAGQIVTDYVFFRVGWLMEVKSITINPNEGTVPISPYGDIQKVYKGRKYTVSVTLKIITMQHPTKCVQLDVPEAKVILAYSGFDELKQPLFGAYFDITASIGVWKAAPTAAEMESFVLSTEGRPYSNGQVEIEIPRSAYTGVGAIYANMFTDYPWLKGVPYSDPEIGSRRVWIQRPPV